MLLASEDVRFQLNDQQPSGCRKAASEIYYGQLVEEESTLTVMAGLKQVIERGGVFSGPCSDRAAISV